jgi:molybdopterin-guanine dinucleotide biosynthesis protein A
MRKVDRFTAPYGVADVAFDELIHNPFFNVNTPEDIVIGQQILQKMGGQKRYNK